MEYLCTGCDFKWDINKQDKSIDVINEICPDCGAELKPAFKKDIKIYKCSCGFEMEHELAVAYVYYESYKKCPFCGSPTYCDEEE